MKRRAWTPEEIEFLKKHYGKMSKENIAERLGRSIHSIAGKAVNLNLTRDKEPTWTEDEVDFMRENWGRLTPEQIGSRLNRSLNAINVKSKRLKLGPIIDASKFTKHEIAKLIATDHRKITKWVKQGLLPATIAKTTSNTKKRQNILQVTPGALERFLKEHSELWDARRSGDIRKAIKEKELLREKVKLQRAGELEKREIPEHLKPAFALFVADVAEKMNNKPKQNDWDKFLKKKTSADVKRYGAKKGQFRWTEQEDNKLRELFKAGHTYKEIGDKLGRSDAAVGHRLARIDVWEGTGS
jgi:hypothetical protein